MRELKTNYWLWAVKIAAAVYNARASASVFYNILITSGLDKTWVVFDTILAVILIDVVFFWVLNELEDWTKNQLERYPVAITAVVLSVVTVLIGYQQEGFLAIAPRAGLLMLVFNDLLGWFMQKRAMYNSWEYQEQKLREEEKLARRKMNQKSFIRAMEALEDQFTEKHRQRILAQLNLDHPPTEHSEPTEEVLPEGIFKTDTGAYGWVNSDGEEVVKTSQAKDYTLRGAKLALARSYNNGT